MKKGIGLLALLCCFSIGLCSCDSCYSKQELLNMNTEETFNKLYPFAMDSMCSPDNHVDVYDLNGIYGNYRFVPCFNSELCVQNIVENNKTINALINYKTGDTIATLNDIVDFAIEYPSSSGLRNAEKVYGFDVFPIAFYATKEGNEAKINFLDCYGNEIYSDQLYEEMILDNISYVKSESEICVIFDFRILSICFKAVNVNKDGEKIQVSRISLDEYRFFERKEYNLSFAKPLYDKDGNIFGYLGPNYTLYNSNKGLVSKINPNSDFPLFDVYSEVRLEKRLLLFGLPDDSKDKLCSYVDWDLVTGETKYITGFKLRGNFFTINTVYEYSKFRYTLVSLVNRDKTQDKVEFKFTFLTDEFNIDNLITDYGGFCGEVYKINSDYLMAEYLNGWHLISKSSNRRIDARDVILDDDNKVYLKDDGMNYCVSTETLIDYFGPEKEGYTSEKLYQNLENIFYVSEEKFNGKRPIIVHGSTSDTYMCNNVKLHHNRVAAAWVYGLLIDDYSIRDINGDILIDYASTGTIKKINRITYIDRYKQAFGLEIEKPDGSTVYRYFIYNCIFG